MRARSQRNLEEAPPSSAAVGTGSISSPLTLSGSRLSCSRCAIRRLTSLPRLAIPDAHASASDPPPVHVDARRARSRRHVSSSSSQPTDPVPCQRQIRGNRLKSPRLAALSLGHNERNRGSDSSSSDSSPSRSRSRRRHKRRRHSIRHLWEVISATITTTESRAAQHSMMQRSENHRLPIH